MNKLSFVHLKVTFVYRALDLASDSSNTGCRNEEFGSSSTQVQTGQLKFNLGPKFTTLTRTIYLT